MPQVVREGCSLEVCVLYIALSRCNFAWCIATDAVLHCSDQLLLHCNLTGLAASLHISKEQLQAVSGFLELCIHAGQLEHHSPELVRTVKRCTRDDTCSSYMYTYNLVIVTLDIICNSCDNWNCIYQHTLFLLIFSAGCLC